mmetsp:Transcript_75287/g.137455  ORF Transcript_75287/g.137455 Transcript_75287/m.137455 type:complete len:464 (-) Transcript_75287:110-1501(-)
MPMRLFAHRDKYVTQKMLITAEYAGLEIEVPAAAGMEDGKHAILETEKGVVFSSSAIARYLARLRRDIGLYGQNLLEAAQIDSWVEFCTLDLEVPLSMWMKMASGSFQAPAEVKDKAKQDAMAALGLLNKHFLSNTYMVGHQITLADISLCCAVVEALKLIIGPEERKGLANLIRWFNLCTVQPEFAKVLGKIEMCSSGEKPAAPKKEPAPKKESPPKKEAASKKEAAPKKEPAEKKEASPKKEAKAKDAAAPKEGKKGKDKAAKEQKPAEEPKAKEKTPEELEADRKKKIKKVTKEGGKRGVEIEGAADMGGLTYFCTSVDEPEGDMELLDMCMTAMNAKSDPTEEERKGGSGHVGKMLFSAGDKQLAIIAYIPEEKKGELDVREWLQKVVDLNGGELCEGNTDLYAKGIVKADGDKGKFPLKMKEPSITEAISFLKAKGLFPDKDDDSDDEFVFGDDDFPS